VKRTAIFLIIALIISTAAIAYADCSRNDRQGWNYCHYCGQYLGQRGGYGMMGGGYDMGPGMMGGQGMMGGGYGMGPGMMGGQGMMGSGMMGGYGQSEECQKFLDETSKERKELYNKRYEYFEAYRNPKTTPETIEKLEKEMQALQGEIYKKAQKVPQGCWY
jgi:hypothetical protein